jgi:hypothetical protein
VLSILARTPTHLPQPARLQKETEPASWGDQSTTPGGIRLPEAPGSLKRQNKSELLPSGPKKKTEAGRRNFERKMRELLGEADLAVATKGGSSLWPPRAQQLSSAAAAVTSARGVAAAAC